MKIKKEFIHTKFSINGKEIYPFLVPENDYIYLKNVLGLGFIFEEEKESEPKKLKLKK